MAQSTDLSSSNFEAYLAKIRAFVGNRDRREILSETADKLAAIVARHSEDELRSRPFEDKWTPNEIIGHLGDTEWVFGYRVRAIYCEHEPDLLGMDHERWVSEQRHNEQAPTALVETFRSLRAVNLGLWTRIKPDELERGGRHNQRGRETLDLNLTLQAGHDLSHIDQIERYLAAFVNP